MRASRSECPAVVERPNDWDITFFDVPKQYAKIDKITMEIMQMDDIRLKFLDFFQQSTCCNWGKASLQAAVNGKTMVDPPKKSEQII